MRREGVTVIAQRPAAAWDDGIAPAPRAGLTATQEGAAWDPHFVAVNVQTCQYRATGIGLADVRELRIRLRRQHRLAGPVSLALAVGTYALCAPAAHRGSVPAAVGAALAPLCGGLCAVLFYWAQRASLRAWCQTRPPKE